MKGSNYEIIVDLDKAIKFKKEGVGNVSDILEIDEIYSDHKKGIKPTESQLETAFGTTDHYAVAETILKNGEILLTQEYRSSEKDKKLKQIVEFISRNAVDPASGNPHPPVRIESAIGQSGINITNKPVEEQAKEIIEKINAIIPLKIQTKRLKITIPAMHTGKVYGVINIYKVSEEWLSNGDLQIIVDIPSGAVMDFYDKLNAVTHGSALSEEIKN